MSTIPATVPTFAAIDPAALSLPPTEPIDITDLVAGLC